MDVSWEDLQARIDGFICWATPPDDRIAGQRYAIRKRYPFPGVGWVLVHPRLERKQWKECQGAFYDDHNYVGQTAVDAATAGAELHAKKLAAWYAAQRDL